MRNLKIKKVDVSRHKSVEVLCNIYTNIIRGNGAFVSKMWEEKQ